MLTVKEPNGNKLVISKYATPIMYQTQTGQWLMSTSNRSYDKFEITHANGRRLKRKINEIRIRDYIIPYLDEHGIKKDNLPQSYFDNLNSIISSETPKFATLSINIPTTAEEYMNYVGKGYLSFVGQPTKHRTHRYLKPVTIQITDKIAIFINEMPHAQYYRDVLNEMLPNLAKIKQDCDKINKYIDRDVDLTIDYGASIDKYDGHTEPEDNKYFIQAYSYHLDNINRELFHVVDKIGTDEQLSKKKDFEPIIKTYQDFLKTNMIGPYEEEFTFVESHDYSNGETQTELFIRLLEHYINKHEGLNVVLFTEHAFDRVVTQFYHDNQEMIDDYFNSTLTKN